MYAHNVITECHRALDIVFYFLTRQAEREGLWTHMFFYVIHCTLPFFRLSNSQHSDELHLERYCISYRAVKCSRPGKHLSEVRGAKNCFWVAQCHLPPASETSLNKLNTFLKLYQPFLDTHLTLRPHCTHIYKHHVRSYWYTSGSRLDLFVDRVTGDIGDMIYCWQSKSSKALVERWIKHVLLQSTCPAFSKM